MQEGLGGLAEGDITWIGWYDNTHSVADKWEAAMAKAGTKGTAYDSVTDGYMRFWSSSEGSYRFAVDLCAKLRVLVRTTVSAGSTKKKATWTPTSAFVPSLPFKLMISGSTG